ncbi:hypothetical protein ACER0C_001686 [Sarotherodon galilaeus]
MDQTDGEDKNREPRKEAEKQVNTNEVERNEIETNEAKTINKVKINEVKNEMKMNDVKTDEIEANKVQTNEINEEDSKTNEETPVSESLSKDIEADVQMPQDENEQNENLQTVNQLQKTQAELKRKDEEIEELKTEAPGQIQDTVETHVSPDLGTTRCSPIMKQGVGNKEV